MIAKVIRRNWRTACGHGLHPRYRYIRGKATAMATRWIVGDMDNAPSQMLGTCRAHGREPGTAFVHLVLSWRAGETPTPDQTFAAADHALHRLGAKGHEAVFAIHGDTSNAHVHILFCRVHPVSGKLLNLWNDYSKLELACREIEARQGWRPDPGRFDAVRTEPARTLHLRPKEAAHWVTKKLRRLTGIQPRPADYDSARGRRLLPLSLRLPDAFLERLAALGSSAASWRAFHDGLAQWGLAYSRSSRGGVISVSGSRDRVAASHVVPDLSLPRLEARLGTFDKPEPTVSLPRRSDPVMVIHGQTSRVADLVRHRSWFGAAGTARLHHMLVSLPRLLKDIRAIRFLPRSAYVELRDGGWIYAEQDRMYLGGGLLSVTQSIVATIVARSLGWAGITLRGQRRDVALMAATAVEAGLSVQSGQITYRAKKPFVPFLIPSADWEFLRDRAIALKQKMSARRETKQIREELLASVSASVVSALSGMDAVPPERWVVLYRAGCHALRRVFMRETDFRRSGNRLPKLDAHVPTAQALTARRHQHLRMDHPLLGFDRVNRVVEPLIHARRESGSIHGDLVYDPSGLVLLAHRDEARRICGYEYISGRRDTGFCAGRIKGSRMTRGEFPFTAGKNKAEVALPNLPYAIHYAATARAMGIALHSLGSYPEEAEVEMEASLEERPSVEDPSNDL